MPRRTRPAAGSRRDRLRLATSPPVASPAVHLPQAGRGPLVSVARRLALAATLLVVVTLLVYVDRGGYRDSNGTPVGLLDALYYSTVSLSTTGYGDVVPESDGARLVNVLVITPLRVLFLIVLVGTTLAVLTERTRSQFRQSRWRSRLDAHTVVVGYGTKGRSAVSVLLDAGTPPGQVVVVDPDQGHVADAVADGLVAVQGDGTRARVLDQAQVARAARVVVAVPRDDTAVLVVLTARAAAPDALVVAAVREGENAPLLKRSGADQVVVSSEAAGRLLGTGAVSPAAGDVLVDLIEPGLGLEVATRPVLPSEVGTDHRHCDERVLAVLRGSALLLFTDPATVPLRAGDQVVVARVA